MSGKCVRIRIEGRVQGVWYRGWTRQQANALGLDGWVRNNRDGSVEGVFSGPIDHVDQMIKQCHSGPPLAEVSGITETPELERPEPGFHTRHSD
ncbi:MAG: acylphosphatase [Rhodospirillales bacterium]|nr:acylphosphatase [Rhodospirillales bacterium]MBT4038596.1 acylphosphatase [Rhodospirillales bacterium]MBT4627247.1 acylphosphatase [Rhodospirillales bacterium]MBT5351563.1 acylphosphatase [Rhodospirillales bacterium]MBT5521537.1 acylphosphatase [Rhodospirillales bacterium]